MKTSLKIRSLVVCIILTMSSSGLKAQVNDINIHYLGHSAFVMDFNDGICALTDFGTSYCWGLNSPIYEIGDFIPLIMTYSHYHEDHYNPDRIPPGVQYTLDSLDFLNIMNLWITPVRTCETTPGVESNTSFIFDYRGFRICHLGDAQAEIMNIADSAQQALILEKFPEQIDLLLMTIEGVYTFIPEAEMLIDLLQPGMVVPIHYWSPEYKEDFLSYLELQNDTAGKTYEVIRHDGPILEMNPGDTLHDHIKVIGLTPFPYGETRIATQEQDHIQNLNIYPNPATSQAKLVFYSTHDQKILYEIQDIYGRVSGSPRQILCKRGHNNIQLDLNELPDGMYFLYIIYTGGKACKRMLISH